MKTTKINLVDRVFQETLVTTIACNLACYFCGLHESSDYPDWKLQMKLDKNTKKWSRIRLFNIVGGDPLLCHDLFALLETLKEEGRKVRLWSNGLFPYEYWDRIIPYLTEIMLYFPIANRERYREITGVDKYDTYDDLISYFKEKNIAVTLNTPVRPDTLDDISEVFENAFRYKVDLWLHFKETEAFNKVEKSLLTRFNTIKGVYCFKTKDGVNLSCPATPVLLSPYAEAMVYLKKALNPNLLLRAYLE